MRMTLAALARARRPARGAAGAAASSALGELRERAAAAARPRPDGPLRQVASAMPPEHYEAGGRARGRADRARASSRRSCSRAKCRCTRRAPYDPAAVFGVLREEFPSCFVFCVGRGEATLIAASPELLVRREGQRVSTLALAGSTRRSADPAVDDHLGEQLLRDRELPRGARDRRAADRAHAARRTRSGSPPRPSRSSCRIANIQHLATPIRAQLAAPIDALELAGLMHPTPAVGGEPRAARGAADPGARGPRPRLVLGPGRLDRRDRRRRVLRRAALRAAARQRRALLRGQRHRARLRPGARARRDRGQAAGAAAAAGGLSAPRATRAAQTRACSSTFARALAAHLDDRSSACAASARSSAARKLGEVLRRARGRGRTARRRGEVEAGRRGDVAV